MPSTSPTAPPSPLTRGLVASGLLTLGLALLSACGSTRARAGEPTDSTEQTKGGNPHAAFAIDFMDTDYVAEAIERAEAEGKLVFVDVYTTWCLPCRLMDEEVFTDPALGRYFNEHFVSLKVDAERGNGGNVAALYEVTAYPTLLFLDTRGRVVARKQGAAFQAELRRLGEQARRATP